MKKLLTLTDVSNHLNIKRRTLYNMIRDGRFPVKAVPKTSPRLWNIEDIEAWRGVQSK